MRLGMEATPFDLASHTIGVHNIALHTAILAKKAGFPVDLPLVSAAALGHDIGKFGCRGEDLSRIAYLHYYYTTLPPTTLPGIWSLKTCPLNLCFSSTQTSASAAQERPVKKSACAFIRSRTHMK